MIIGDERLGPLKELLLNKRRDIIIMDAEGTPVEDVKCWLLHEDNANLIPTRLVYIMAGLWNLVTPYDYSTTTQGIKLVTGSSTSTDTPIVVCEIP